MHSRCGLIEVDLVMEPPAQPYQGCSGGSSSVILAAGHHGLTQSRQDLLENGSAFLGPKVGAPLCDELEGAARGTRRSMDHIEGFGGHATLPAPRLVPASLFEGGNGQSCEGAVKWREVVVKLS